jgi:hypothetical protein
MAAATARSASTPMQRPSSSTDQVPHAELDHVRQRLVQRRPQTCGAGRRITWVMCRAEIRPANRDPGRVDGFHGRHNPAEALTTVSSYVQVSRSTTLITPEPTCDVDRDLGVVPVSGRRG